MRVIVCILTDDPHSERVTRLYGCFEHDLFTVNCYNVAPKFVDDETNTEDAIFKYRLKWCLRDVGETYPDDYTLVVKDDIICSTDTNTLANIITEVITSRSDWDIVYLSAWGDDVKKYERVKDIPGLNMYIAKTNGPKGSNAFLLTPEARIKLIANKKLSSVGNMLKGEIKSGNMGGNILVPTPMSIDPSLAETYQLNIHSGSSFTMPGMEMSGSALSIVWYVAVVIFTIFFLFVSVKFMT